MFQTDNHDMACMSFFKQSNNPTLFIFPLTQNRSLFSGLENQETDLRL